MEVKEISIPKVWFREIHSESSSYVGIHRFKTRPIKRDITEIIKYIDKAYLITLEPMDIDILTKSVGSEVFGRSIISSYIKDNITAYYSKFTIYDFTDEFLKYQMILKNKQLVIKPEELVVLNFNDTINVVNTTAKEKARLEKLEKIHREKNVVKTMLLPSIKQICNENGLIVKGNDIYFNSLKDLKIFIQNSLEEQFGKKFKEIGVKVNFSKCQKLQISKAIATIDKISIEEIK